MSRATSTMAANRKHHLRMMRDILSSYNMLQKKQVLKSKSRGSTRNRVCRSVAYMYEILGPDVRRKAYRMSYESFLKLYEKIWPYYNIDSNVWYVHNGRIHPSVWLACAIRYFSGGAAYDIMVHFGIALSAVYMSIWQVVTAINMVPEFSISYPVNHDDQKTIARRFQEKSSADIGNCAGAIDGMPIWTSMPTEEDCNDAGCAALKFMCGRKHKYGMNCQAVSDARGRFLDISIRYPGSTSDVLAFEGSKLYQKLERGLLAHGLCLFGDNAYINKSYMATPYSGKNGKSHDSYNFYHSQLRIQVECAFGMLTERWSILRSCLPKRFTLKKIAALVVALAKLHNFCINMNEGKIAEPLASDEANLVLSGGYLNLEPTALSGGQRIPLDLIDGGNHMDDFDRKSKRPHRGNREKEKAECMPREILQEHVQNKVLTRPQPCPCKRRK